MSYPRLFLLAFTPLPENAGRDPAEVQRGRLEEERDHHPFPGDTERDSGPNRGTQQPQHQAVPGEQRSGRETQGAHFTIRPARGGIDPATHPEHTRTQPHKLWKWIPKPQSTCKPTWDILNCTNVKSHTSGPLTCELFAHFTKVAVSFQFYAAKEMETAFCVKKKQQLLNSPDCLPEPGEGVQTQRPERKAAGDQTHAGKHDDEGGRGQAQAGKRARTFCVSDLSSAIRQAF